VGLRFPGRAKAVRIDAEGEGKKLKGAAQHWANARLHGSPVADDDDENEPDIIVQMRELGSPDDVIERTRSELAAQQAAALEAAFFGVHPDNWLAANVFLALSTQWVLVTGFGAAAYTGLNYQSVESAINMLNVRRSRQPRLLHEIRVMEAAALKVFADDMAEKAAKAEAHG
jgi:hypothetical protein